MRRSTLGIVAAGLAAVLFVPARVGLTAPPDPADRLTAETRTVEAADGTSVQADVGTLAVPENRTNPDARLIEVGFARLRCLSGEARAAPLVYLAGGPGGTSAWMADEPRAVEAWLPYLEFCDVILVDQRGTGPTGSDLMYRSEELPPLDVLADRDKAYAWLMTVSRRARGAVRARGVDLDGYTTPQSADDIDELRQALGLEEISITGFSYGTHLGLCYIRRHGEHVENAVLTGVEGPDQTFKLPIHAETHLRRLSRIIAQDPVVGPEMPDFYGTLKRVLEKLEREPLTVTIPAPDGTPVDLQVGRFGVEFVLRFDLGDASDLVVFPRLIHSIDQGETDVLKWFVLKRAPILIGMNAMTVVMDTASGASPQRMAMIQSQADETLLGDIVNLFDQGVIDIWDPPDLGSEYRSPVVSDVRTLFLSGTLDWNTPPFQAEQARWGFPDSQHIIVRNAGHEQILPNRDVQDAIRRFLQGEDVSNVTASNPPLRFVPLEGYDEEVTHPSVPRP